MGDSIDKRNIEAVAKVVTKELLEKAIKQSEKIEDVSVKDFDVKWAGILGDNFATAVLRVKVLTACEGKEREFSIILKTSNDNEDLNKMMVRAGFFKKEIGSYVEIVPALIKMQEDLGVDPIIPSLPKYIYGIEDTVSTPGVVMVEDLCPAGFKMIEKRKGADLNHCRLVMKELATWHALSMVLKNRDRETLESKFPYVFKEGQWGSAFGAVQETFMPDAIKAMVKLVQESSCSEEIKACAEKFLEIGNPIAKIREMIKPEEPFATMCHGDSWCNNMLFRYENIDGVDVPIEIKLLDLQVVRYALPTTDLAYFIYLSTSRNLRKAHLDELLKLYHETYMGVIQHCQYEFPEFTLDVVKRLFKKVAIFGVIVGMLVLPFFHGDQEDFEALDKARREADSMENYLERIEEMKNDLVEQEKINGPEDRKNKKTLQIYTELIEDAIEFEVV